MEFNTNHNVRVRLTDHGRMVHRKSHDDMFGGNFPYELPKEDADGWSEWQLWDLMSQFGEHIHMIGPIPFETTIRIGDD